MQRLKEFLQEALMGVGVATIVIFLLVIGGCGKKSAPSVAVESFSVPLYDTTTKPDIIHLIPGQTAKLMEPVEVKAQVPYGSGELYEGTVRFEVGSMVVKPRGE